MPKVAHSRNGRKTKLAQRCAKKQILHVYSVGRHSDTSKTASKLVQGFLGLGVRLLAPDMAPYLGGQIPQKTQSGGVNRRLPAKLAKSKNMHIMKTTASIPTKFYPQKKVHTHPTKFLGHRLPIA